MFFLYFMEQFLRNGKYREKALENYWTVRRNKRRLFFAMLRVEVIFITKFVTLVFLT